MNERFTWPSRIAARLQQILGDPQVPADPALAPAVDRLNALRQLADTTPDSTRASTYDAIWRTMGEELGYIAHDLDTGRVTEADLPARFAEWDAIGRAHLSHDQAAADVVFGPTEPASDVSTAGYHPAADVTRVRGYLNGEQWAAVENGQDHRYAVIDEFHAQLDALVETYTLQADFYRSEGQDAPAGVDREAFLREAEEHARYFNARLYPGPGFTLPDEVAPSGAVDPDVLLPRYEQLFATLPGWSAKQRHPILDTTAYQPPAPVRWEVRDHAAAIHAWVLAVANDARTTGNHERAQVLAEYADHVAALLDQYENSAEMSPTDFEAGRLASLDQAAFGAALDEATAIHNARFDRAADRFTVPADLHPSGSGDRAYDVDVSADVDQRYRELFPALYASTRADEAVTSPVRASARVDNADEWMALDPPDLGQQAVVQALSHQADQAVVNGDSTAAAQYRDAAHRLAEQAQADQWNAVVGALAADDRHQYITEQRNLVQARIEKELTTQGLTLPRSDDACADDLVTEHAINSAVHRLSNNTTGARAELLDHDHRDEPRGSDSRTSETYADTHEADIPSDAESEARWLAAGWEAAPDVMDRDASQAGGTEQNEAEVTTAADQNVEQDDLELVVFEDEVYLRAMQERAAAEAAESSGDACRDDTTANDEAERQAEHPRDDLNAHQADDAAPASLEPRPVTETSSCTVAVTRAQLAVQRVHERIEEDQRQAASDREAELAQWNADDTRAEHTHTATAQATQQHDHSAPATELGSYGEN
ncbi:hypothetical protein Kfla_2191 [Kribbella flavida DSM 17836]|uniref:Uncharacterized protein n=1 Tax=Kribbella flavida (strain DSM 17836 / JCM 10339 / NBRC 14399) TaxID=479435 RepID=D2PTF7_KRIFD|nr:hypothetical protein [Kribbella flavida]ADB31270.1 hypothetical protein Kfla_2191 [Kribbella flavida DSM 17836]